MHNATHWERNMAKLKKGMVNFPVNQVKLMKEVIV
jgi:hypothetical protein